MLKRLLKNALLFLLLLALMSFLNSAGVLAQGSSGGGTTICNGWGCCTNYSWGPYVMSGGTCWQLSGGCVGSTGITLDGFTPVDACYCTGGCGGGGGGGGAPACRALNQSCTPPGGKAGQGNCCSGKTCQPDGKGGGTCKNNGCGAAGKTGSDYADGCCGGLSPDGKGACQCSTPAAPSSLSPNNTAVCPVFQNLSWQPAGKTYNLRVDSNSDSSPLSCGSPAAKDHAGDECVQTTERPWSYSTVAGSAVAWSVNTVNTASGCNQPSGKTSASFTVSSQPTAPTNVRPTGNITAGTQAIRWTAPSNADSNTRYHVRIDNAQNDWNGSCSSPNAGDSCVDNLTATQTNYNFQTGNTYNLWVTATSCSFSAISSSVVQVSVPNPYPQATIHGTLREYSGGACYDDISTSSTTVTLIPQNSSGVTTDCSVTPSSGTTHATYSCTIDFDALGNPDPSQNFTVAYSTTEYQAPYLSAPNVCSASGTNVVAVDVSGASPTTDYNYDLLFKPAGPWVKIKNGSFAATNNVANPLPNSITAFDSEDDASQRYFVMSTVGNDPGTVVAQGLNLGSADASSRDWKATSYAKSNTLAFGSYFDYVKARKEYKNITNSDLSEITADGIYVWTGSGDLTLNDSNEGQLDGKVVIISEGTINITQNLTPTGSVGVFADTISFTGGVTPVTQAKGVFVSNIMNTGSADQGLKITGNFVTQTLNNDRVLSDTSKPSIFVSFSPSLFLDLLPWASISKYEYRQTQ